MAEQPIQEISSISSQTAVYNPAVNSTGDKQADKLGDSGSVLQESQIMSILFSFKKQMEVLTNKFEDFTRSNDKAPVSDMLEGKRPNGSDVIGASGAEAELLSTSKGSETLTQLSVHPLDLDFFNQHEHICGDLEGLPKQNLSNNLPVIKQKRKLKHLESSIQVVNDEGNRTKKLRTVSTQEMQDCIETFNLHGNDAFSDNIEVTAGRGLNNVTSAPLGSIPVNYLNQDVNTDVCFLDKEFNTWLRHDVFTNFESLPLGPQNVSHTGQNSNTIGRDYEALVYNIRDTMLKVKRLQLTNTYLQANITAKQIPMGLRLSKNPMGIFQGTSEAAELTSILDDAGFRILNLLIKVNGKKIDNLLVETQRLHKDFITYYDAQKTRHDFEALKQDIDSIINKERETKRKKFARDKKAYAEGTAYKLFKQEYTGQSAQNARANRFSYTRFPNQSNNKNFNPSNHFRGTNYNAFNNRNHPRTNNTLRRGSFVDAHTVSGPQDFLGVGQGQKTFQRRR